MAFGLAMRPSGRRLAVVFTVLSLIHIPLPEPDYHNVRHHDAPGEICPYHDHLLRWHPTAGTDEDVAILHWHWFLPFQDSSAPGHSAAEHGSAAGPLVHAQQGEEPAFDWSSPTFLPVDRGAAVRTVMLDLALGVLPCLPPAPRTYSGRAPSFSRSDRTPAAPSPRLNC